MLKSYYSVCNSLCLKRLATDMNTSQKESNVYFTFLSTTPLCISIISVCTKNNGKTFMQISAIKTSSVRVAAQMINTFCNSDLSTCVLNC